MTPAQRIWIEKAKLAAEKAFHVFPVMAACEAALESGYGASFLASKYNNLFGMKQHAHAVYGTVTLPTREFIKSQWVMVSAKWVDYPDWASCFADRKATLERLSNAYPHYRAALDAPDAETYCNEVSKTWSTDPDRAMKVIAIYRTFLAYPTAHPDAIQ